MVSLTLYNRRQRALWIENEMQKLQDAKAAYVAGSATPAQLELLKNEKIAEIMKQKKDEEKAHRPWNQLKTYIFGGLKSDETATDAAAAASTESGKPGVLEALNAKTAEDASAAALSTPTAGPGQLDVLADNAEAAAKQTTRSWKSWLTGR
ncbi:hypothetical protein BJX96DRAFT_176430 [Aspergillus floccosus]